MKRFIGLSLLIHILLLCSTIVDYKNEVGSTETESQDGSEDKHGNDDKPFDVEIVEMNNGSSPDDSTPCKSFFGGIGVNGIPSSEGYHVTNIHNGYPADQSGIQYGDILKPTNDTDIIGEIGTLVVLRVNRYGKVFTLNIIRGKICTE